jgi:phage tail sheath protein FI
MAFQVSPGVNISEIDASTSVPALATNTGGLVGRFSKGPIDEIVTVSSVEELRHHFGDPAEDNYRSWFTAANFLSYSNSLKVVRVANDDDSNDANRIKNAISGIAAATVATARTDNFTGQSSTTDTVFGSSAQAFTYAVSTTAPTASVDLHTTADSAGNYLLPRQDTGNALVTSSGAAAGTDTPVRILSGSDVQVSVRGVNETSGGLVPTARYSLSGQAITFETPVGQTANSGPYYIHSADGAAVGAATTNLGSGFYYPVYDRVADAEIADAGTYNGDGVAVAYFFQKYGGGVTLTSDTNDTVTLDNADHGFQVGDAVVYVENGGAAVGLTDGTIYYVASVNAATIGLSATFDFQANTAGSAVDISVDTLAPNVAGGNIYKVWYMPDEFENTATAAAPANTAIKLFADANDQVVINVAQQTVFTLSNAPGTYAVENQSIAATNDVDGVYAATDFSIAANSADFTFLSNAPLTGETVTITVPARRSFTLGQAVTATQTVEVTVNGVPYTEGAANNGFSLVGDRTRILFATAPAGGDAIVVRTNLPEETTYTFSTTVYLPNKDAFDALGFGNAGFSGHEFAFKDSGAVGNKYKIYLVDESSYDNFVINEPSIAAVLSGAPTADDNTVDPVTNDSQGISIVVTEMSPAGETVVEVLENMSKASNGKTEDGTNIYYVDRINNLSNYVYVLNHPTGTTDWGQDITLTKTSFARLNTTGSATGAEQYVEREFGNGRNGIAPTTGAFSNGTDLFADSENVDIAFLLAGEALEIASSVDAARAAAAKLIQVASDRKDTVACLSPRYADVVTDANARSSDAQIAFWRSVGSNNYAFVDSNYKYQYDKYADKFRWVPFNGDVAGLMVRSEQERDAWYSPAGFNRGNVKNVVKTLQTQDKADRDSLYKNAINPVVNFSGQGTVLFGDKTFTTKSSAFSRINVRRLFIVLEKSIAAAAKFTLFEFNDEFTRSQFTSLIEPFLREVQGRRGIYDFRVVCDETNNTAEVIDQNQFVGDIYIKPARSINFIQLNFVAVRTGVDFDEIVGAV